MAKLLITGGCGFVGSHIVEHLLKETYWDIVIIDRLDFTSSLERLRDIDIWEEQKHRVKFIWWDLKSEINDFIIKQIEDVNYVWHLAASSHVDRSIIDPLSFVMDNVVGTCNILNFVRNSAKNIEKFFYMGTDESFGPASENINFKEWDRYNSTNPYSASKSGAEELCLAFANTYKLPIAIGHTMNIYGERQHPEKFIPIIIKKVLAGEKLTIHDGSRYWIHARNVADALMFVNFEKDNREKYNIVGEVELSNLELAQKIAGILEKPLNYELVEAVESRPGHDKRYSLDGSKMQELGWEHPKSFEESLEKTVKWIADKDNSRWL